MLLLPLVASLLAQSPSAADERAAVAAEKAADAAKSAAEAAQRSADALQKLVELEAAEKAPPPAAAPAPAAPAPSPWSGGVSLGFTYLAGNSNSVTFAGAANVQRKTQRWIYGAKVFGAYGLTTPADGAAPQTVALNAGINAQIDFRLIERVSILIAGGLDTDHVKSVELRGYGDVGVGIIWVDQKVEDYQKLMLKTDITFRVGSEGRYNYYPTATNACYLQKRISPNNVTVELTPADAPLTDASGNAIEYFSCGEAAGGGGSVLQIAPRASVAFKYSLTKSIFFTDDFEIMPTVAGSFAGRLSVNNTAKVSIRPIPLFGISASWVLNVDTRPAKGKKEIDNAVIGSLDLAF